MFRWLREDCIFREPGSEREVIEQNKLEDLHCWGGERHLWCLGDNWTDEWFYVCVFSVYRSQGISWTIAGMQDGAIERPFWGEATRSPWLWPQEEHLNVFNMQRRAQPKFFKMKRTWLGKEKRACLPAIAQGRWYYVSCLRWEEVCARRQHLADLWH